MTLKLEVGEQYRTRGGWRCVVLRTDKLGSYMAWHDSNDEFVWHEPDGGYKYHTGEHDHDIIAKWEDPKTHTYWVILNDLGYPAVSDLRPEVLWGKGMSKVVIVEGEYEND
jgi:hypothetical protein